MPKSEGGLTATVGSTTKIANEDPDPSSIGLARAFRNFSELAEKLTQTAPYMLNQRIITYGYVLGLSIC